MRFSQAEITSQHRIFELHVGAHRVRIVLDMNGRRGVYSPRVNLHLHGPNGSPAGVGSKSWPKPLAWLLGVRYSDHDPRKTYASTLSFAVPHLCWHRAFKLRRVGGLKLYRVNYSIIRRTMTNR